MASLLEEQQEKLRRAVDEWRSQSHDLLKDLPGDPSGYSPSPSRSGGSSSDPVRLHIEPIEHSALSALLDSDNVAVSKFVTVLSHDCIEISRLQQHASKNLYRQLLLFGHSVSNQEVLLEGEPQKAFARSLSLFMDLYETTSRMTAVLANLLQQLNSIYSSHDKNVRPLNSFRDFTLRSVFASLGDGLAVFLVLDEILRQNSCVKGHLSLFARMLKKVKLDVNTFEISAEDLDFLDQVVSHLEKILDLWLFQRLLQEESSLQAALQHARCNRKFIDACSSCIHDGLSEILPRLNTWKEFPFDRRKILHYLALFLFSSHASAEVPEKKIGKLILEMLEVVPIIYVEGGKRIILSDVLKSQCPQLLSLWPSLRETSRDCDVLLRNYLARFSEMHLRESVAIKDTLTGWIASFQSTVHPASEMLNKASLRLHLKQIMQGILLANRMQIIVLSMLDLHALLEVPIRREKLNSLCHMVISLKVVENIFQTKGLEIIQSLPHIINVIQDDIEHFLLPFKDKLQSEVTKGRQASKLGFLSSLTRGGRDTDTRLTDSLSLILISLQLLQGSGSHKRQLTLSITLDILQSIGHINFDFPRIRKVISKLVTVADCQSIIEEVTNCSFLYWRKEMIGNWFSMVYMDDSKFMWLQYLLDSFSDGLWLLKLGHVGKLTLQSYEKEIEGVLKNEIIAPLCRDIETDLRLHVHSTHLKGSVFVNPTKTGVRSLSWYLQIKPLRLPFKIIDVKSLVESYLNSAFYNHTTMSPYDWKMYLEMCQLAELKYGLALDDIHLVEQSQGFDISKTIQNLHAFTENYSYHNIKQGGELNIAIRKSPLGNHGLSFAEQLQSVITKMGNALGLMRMLLAGDSRHSCNLSRSISRPRPNMSFMEGCQKLAFPDEIVTAGRVMDRAIESSCQSDAESFSFYISLFSKELENSKYHHLTDFFVILPSLIVNMIDAKVQFKDKQLKRDQSSGNIVDTYDGFTMGVAYVLKVLRQEKSFNELDWFASAKKNLEQQVSLLKDSGKGPEPKRESSSLSGLKLWSQAPTISAEAQKGIEKFKRDQKELEFIEYGLKVAKTILS